MRIKLISVMVLLVVIILVSLGCNNFPARNDMGLDWIPVKVSEDGIKYKIVTIEGQKFIAVQNINQDWIFSNLNSAKLPEVSFYANVIKFEWNSDYSIYYFEDGGFLKIKGYKPCGIPQKINFFSNNGLWDFVGVK